MQFTPTRLAVENTPEWYSPGGSFKDLATYYTSLPANPREYLAGMGYSPMARYRDRYAAMETDGRRYQNMRGFGSLGDISPAYLTLNNFGNQATSAIGFHLADPHNVSAGFAASETSDSISAMAVSLVNLATNQIAPVDASSDTQANDLKNQLVNQMFQIQRDVTSKADVSVVLGDIDALGSIVSSSNAIMATAAASTAPAAAAEGSPAAAASAAAAAGPLTAYNAMIASANQAAIAKRQSDCATTGFLTDSSTGITCANYQQMCGQPMPSVVNAACNAGDLLGNLGTYAKYAAIGVAILLLMKGKKAVGL